MIQEQHLAGWQMRQWDLEKKGYILPSVFGWCHHFAFLAPLGRFPTVSCKEPLCKSENVLARGIVREMRTWNLELTGTYLSNCWCEGIFILPFGTGQFSITPVIVTHVSRTIYTCCVTQGTVGHATPSGFGCNEGHDHCLKSRYEESKVTHGAYKADLISAHAADLLQYLINVQCHYDKETWSGEGKRRLGTRVINWGYVHTIKLG